MKGNKGITLIALIITIIVLLILAIVSVKVIIDNKIFKHAEYATNNYQIEQEKEQIKLAYSSYKMSKTNNSEYTMQEALNDNKINASVEEIEGGWNITFAETGNNYILNENGQVEKWHKTSEGITNGKVTVQIGDYVEYDELSNGSKNWTAKKIKGVGVGFDEDTKQLEEGVFSTEDLKWKVLGINSNGDLELVSDSATNNELYIYGEQGYLNCEEQLNEMCSTLYGNGNNVISARSLNHDDINVLLNYDKSKSGGIYGKWCRLKTVDRGTQGTWWYEISDDYDPKTKEGTWEIKGGLSGPKKIIKMPGEEAIKYGKTTTPYKNNVYIVLLSDFTLNEKLEELIYGSNKKDFFLATRMIGDTAINTFRFDCVISVFMSDENRTERGFLYKVIGVEEYCKSCFVRPVVTISSDIQLTGSSEEGWTILK